MNWGCDRIGDHFASRLPWCSQALRISFSVIWLVGWPSAMKSRCNRCPPMYERDCHPVRRICSDQGRLTHGRSPVELGMRISSATLAKRCSMMGVCKVRNPHMVIIVAFLLDVRLFPTSFSAGSLALQNPPPFHPVQLCNPVVPSPWSCLTLTRYCPPPSSAQAQAPILPGPPVANLRAPPYH